MFSVFERLISFGSKPHPHLQPQPQPKLCIYKERIKCFQKLIELQTNLKATSDEYINISRIEEKTLENTFTPFFI